MQAYNKNSFRIGSACFLIQAIGVGTFVTYGVFFTSLVDEFQWPRAVISGASSTAFILSGIFAILIGRLSDIHGPRVLMSVAACLYGAGLLLTSQVTEVWHLYLYYGCIFGIGLGSIDVIALTTTARWFTRSRGTMTGIVKVGTGAGQFLIPFLASVLIVAVGWRQSIAILGAFSFLSLLAIAQLLKRDPQSQSLRSKQKERRNQQALDSAVIESDGMGAGAALHTPQLWLLLLVTLITEFCLLIVLVHIVPHARDVGLSPTQAAGVLSTIGAVSMVGRFFSGLFIDRFGCRAIARICYAVLIASIVWLLSADNLWMLYCFGAIYGLAHGSFFTFISPIVVEIFGLAAHGTIFGIIVFAGTAGGAVGPIIAGQIFDVTGSYALVFRLLAVLCVTAFGLMLLLKPLKKPYRSECAALR